MDRNYVLANGSGSVDIESTGKEGSAMAIVYTETNDNILVV
jgi:hypothetical protein